MIINRHAMIQTVNDYRHGATLQISRSSCFRPSYRKFTMPVDLITRASAARLNRVMSAKESTATWTDGAIIVYVGPTFPVANSLNSRRAEAIAHLEAAIPGQWDETNVRLLLSQWRSEESIIAHLERRSP